jgi:hypothetical protein
MERIATSCFVQFTNNLNTLGCIPRQPQAITLTETSKEAVVEALSKRSTDFKNALEFQIEYAEDLQSLENKVEALQMQHT